MITQPSSTVRASEGMVSSDDQLASQAGLAMLRAGGTAADAAVATNAVLAVTMQNMCGLGGDLLAVISMPGSDPIALNASGFAGSGVDAGRLRSEGFATMPLRDHMATVTVPGCVDGWLALHARFGALELAEVLEPARWYAAHGFPASPDLARDVETVAHLPEAGDYLHAGPLHAGSPVRRPGVARTLEAIVAAGRGGFYGGEFGAELLAVGAGQFAADDLSRPIATWSPALHARAWGREIWTVPPNSQGYLTLAGAAIAAALPVPDDPEDPQWAHLLVESARQAAYDRPEVLHDRADGAALVAEARLAPRRAAIDPVRAARLGDVYGGGGTIALTAVDRDRMGISLLQSNASGFGARIGLPATRIFLHNRGMAFSLQPGHPAEYVPGRRPPHTLCPTVVTTPDGSLAGVLGAAGGDGQPQIMLQVLARWLHCGMEPGDALAAGRWMLAHADGGSFNTWEQHGRVQVLVEGQAPSSWAPALEERDHLVRTERPFSRSFGHAQLITVGPDGLAGACDPRPRSGAAVGY